MNGLLSRIGVAGAMSGMSAKCTLQQDREAGLLRPGDSRQLDTGHTKHKVVGEQQIDGIIGSQHHESLLAGGRSDHRVPQVLQHGRSLSKDQGIVLNHKDLLPPATPLHGSISCSGAIRTWITRAPMSARTQPASTFRSDVQLPTDFFAQAVVVTKGVEPRERVKARLEQALTIEFPSAAGRVYPLKLGPCRLAGSIEWAGRTPTSAVRCLSGSHHRGRRSQFLEHQLHPGWSRRAPSGSGLTRTRHASWA